MEKIILNEERKSKLIDLLEKLNLSETENIEDLVRDALESGQISVVEYKSKAKNYKEAEDEYNKSFNWSDQEKVAILSMVKFAQFLSHLESAYKAASVADYRDGKIICIRAMIEKL